MAADAYLKVAAGQLQQAASAVKQDVERLHAEAATFRQQAEHDITNKQSKIAAWRVKADSNRGTPKVVAIELEIKRMEQEMVNLKQQISQRNDQVAQATKGKEGAMAGLQSEATKLSRQASDPNLQ